MASKRSPTSPQQCAGDVTTYQFPVASALREHLASYAPQQNQLCAQMWPWCVDALVTQFNERCFALVGIDAVARVCIARALKLHCPLMAKEDQDRIVRHCQITMLSYAVHRCECSSSDDHEDALQFRESEIFVLQ